MELIKNVAGTLCPECGEIIRYGQSIAKAGVNSWKHADCSRALSIVHSNPNPERTMQRARLTLVA